MTDSPLENTLPPLPEEPLPVVPERPLRILFAITKANWGGAQRYVYELAIAAKEKGYDVVVAYGTEGLLVQKLQTQGIRTIALSGVERDVALFSNEPLRPHTIIDSIKREWSTLHTLIKLLKEERPDIFHVNSSKIGGLGAVAGRIARVPRIIFTAHGWAFNEHRPWWQKPLFRLLYTITLWLSHRTICVSEAVRRDMEFFPFSHLSVVRHGITPPPLLARNEAREKLLPSMKEAYWLGMVAELHPTKRIEDVIDALAELSTSHPEAILVVMGEGELREKLTERIAHYGFENRVFLLGFVEDAPKYLHAFDIFVMPSRTEALGLALLEAGHAALPVVASRVGGIPEIVRHKETGLLVPKENPHALARALRALIEHPEDAKKYGEALHARVMEKFSKERMIEETFALYERS